MVFLIANWIGDADQIFVLPTLCAWSFLFIDGMGSLSLNELELEVISLIILLIHAVNWNNNHIKISTVPRFM